MAQEIEVIIAGDGKVELEVKGVRGKQCLHLTREIETGLGALINRKTKPEFVLNSRVDRGVHTLKIDQTCRSDSIDTEGA
jgi:hypothetical protein